MVAEHALDMSLPFLEVCTKAPVDAVQLQPLKSFALRDR